MFFFVFFVCSCSFCSCFFLFLVILPVSLFCFLMLKSTFSVPVGVIIRGGLIHVRRFWWPLQHKSSFGFRFRRKSRTKRLPGDLWRNPLVTLGLSDRSRCGAVQILRPLARGAHSDDQGDLTQSFANILPRGLLQRSCQESSYRELVQRSHKEILPRFFL